MTDESAQTQPQTQTQQDDPTLARVRAAIERVEHLAGAPLPDSATAYQEIHGELQAALAEVDGG